jgi:hypothetical protein
VKFAALFLSLVNAAELKVRLAAGFVRVQACADEVVDTPLEVETQLVVELLQRHADEGTIVADEPEVLAELFLGMVAAAPARLASFGIERAAADQERHTRAAVQLFLRSLRPSAG